QRDVGGADPIGDLPCPRGSTTPASCYRIHVSLDTVCHVDLLLNVVVYCSIVDIPHNPRNSLSARCCSTHTHAPNAAELRWIYFKQVKTRSVWSVANQRRNRCHTPCSVRDHPRSRADGLHSVLQVRAGSAQGD